MNFFLCDSPSPTDLLTRVVPVLKQADETDAAGQADQLAALTGLPATLLTQTFKAGLNDVLPVLKPDGSAIYLLGLGDTPTVQDWLKATRKFFVAWKTKLPADVTIDLRSLPAEVLTEPALESIGLGALLGGYDLRLYQTDRPDKPVLYAETGRLTLLIDPKQLEWAQKVIDRVVVLADTQLSLLDLMNAPANYKTPQTLADWTTESGRQHGYAVRVLNKADLEAEGLGALLSVSQGSEVPPVLIIADYTPANPATDAVPTVGLVGKGVTFDTGGISIKTSANMHLMKSDMGGAAAVLGAVAVAARLQLPVRVVGIVPATENSIDGRSTKPGDVITSYVGKTIEIIDTDAEGRVILADGLGYMIRNYQPDVLIDLATLTGSVITTLGYHAAGLFTANDTLAQQLTAAADTTGERLWRLPIWEEYREDIKSDVADVKNFSGKPLAGAITAAKFLEAFTDKHPAWAHLDIAGTAFADNEFGTQKNATGYGIRLLTRFLSKSERAKE
ncbi:leucyl aminopeptidase family protein [Spirosoma rhododendri]|uniref:Probable cytosol aminopeptidase n=1 Tax=Spirosoma rhododendri TaxID=2728024 RepID=A0A7L5DNH5_9BACT|nr:leucyl aminopeptidase [Spirosoma rhododendri]QJD80034.1 leucyl aminopeptidase [Spirosoma rhododendri]